MAPTNRPRSSRKRTAPRHCEKRECLGTHKLRAEGHSTPTIRTARASCLCSKKAFATLRSAAGQAMTCQNVDDAAKRQIDDCIAPLGDARSNEDNRAPVRTALMIGPRKEQPRQRIELAPADELPNAWILGRECFGIALFICAQLKVGRGLLKGDNLLCFYVDKGDHRSSRVVVVQRRHHLAVVRLASMRRLRAERDDASSSFLKRRNLRMPA